MKMPRLHTTRGPLLLGAMLVVFALGVLLPGLKLADALDDTAAAERALADHAREPATLAAALALARDRLDTYGFVDAPLRDVRRSVAALDELIRRLKDDSASSGVLASHPARAVPAADLQDIERAWNAYRATLAPMLDVKGLPYTESEARGTELNATGRALADALRNALGHGRAQNEALTQATGQLSASLERRSAALSRYLRYLMLAALAGAGVLGVSLGGLLLTRRRQARLLAGAQKQTADILRTVKEGLFLLDAGNRIGAVYSESMSRLFHRDDLGGLALAELLRPLVAEKTLDTAQKFIEVLWSERTRENLVRSINPLQEVEVSFDNGAGGREVRFLDFDFHRVREGERVVSLLVSVTDVSQRVALGREIASLREQSQNQADTLFGILHLDPHQVRAFLDESLVTLKMINAILREPARDTNGFRRKVESIFRQVHTLKGEAAALGLGTIEARAHAFEDDLKAVESRVELSGSDFLPLVVRLDDLLNHVRSLGELVQRFAARGTEGAADPAAPPATPAATLEQLLRGLADTVAKRHDKELVLDVQGLEAVPPGLLQPVKNIAVQLVRNAVVHGIEAPAVRAGHGKPGAGRITVEFRTDPAEGYRLQITDDGAGLSPSRIRDAAVSRGILSGDDAQSLDSKTMLGLLFRPGFSTLAEPDEDGGRGVGMSVVAELVRTLKGRVAVASNEGRYTRFTISLPSQASAGQADAA